MSRQSWLLRTFPILAVGVLSVEVPNVVAAQEHPDLPSCYSYCWVNSCAYFGWIEVVSPWQGGPPGNSRLPVTNYCYPGSCDVCPGAIASRALVPAIVAAASAGNVGELEKLISDHRETVVLNLERQAIQVAGCSNGQVVASIPIPALELAALRRAIAAQAAEIALAAVGDSGVAVLGLRWR